MGQPIEQCPGQALRSECFGPLVERQIAGDQRGAALVTPDENFEQQLRAGLG